MRLTGNNQLKEAVKLARQGDATQSLALLRQIIEHDPNNVFAWMWLAYVAPDSDQKRAALRRALALKPNNRQVRTILQRLTTPLHIQRAVRDGVFMGYSRSDEIFAIDVNDNLRANGIKTWLDMTEIDPDTTWHNSVVQALHNCGLMVMILSPAALRSDDLQSELDWFMQKGKIVVPVLHESCDYHGLNLMCPPVDFRSDFGHGVQSLLQLLITPQTAQNGV